MKMLFNIVSYNVLSTNLTNAHSPKRNPEHLSFVYRRKIMKEDLKKLITPNTIFCLQEVCDTWFKFLYKFFKEENYEIIRARSSFDYCGNFGPAIAYPSNLKYLDHDIIKVSNVLPKTDKISGYFETYVSKYLPEKICKYLEINTSLFKKDFVDQDIGLVNNNKNEILFVKFVLPDERIFVVGSWHSPCKFQNPRFMNLISACFRECVTKYCKENPFVIGGDFNITPDSDHMKILTGDSNIPEISNDKKIKVIISENPTNISLVNYNNQKFIGILDYIFYNKLKLVNFINPPNLNEYIPNEYFPSDHLPLISTFEI